LLGTPELQTPKGILKLPLERISWLLTILAARADWVRREEIMMLLWAEDVDISAVQQRLRQLLYRTKQLGFVGIESEVGRLRWVGTSDLLEFKAALQAGQELEALQLCQGELLEGVLPNDTEFGAWLVLERESIALQRQELALRLAKQSPPLEGLTLLEGLPLNEEVVLEALRLAGSAGAVARAEIIFFRFERMLSEFDEIPSDELKTALERARNALISSNKTVVVAASGFMSLPTALTPLLGRETELACLQDWLIEHSVITVLGIGGIGKTSLALEAARAFQGEAVFVSLVGLEAKSSFAPSIMAALGLSFASSQALDDDLFVALSRRQQPLLLVLDNVEQCIETARDFATRFGALQNLKLLFTSRSRLGVRIEHILELNGLGLPTCANDLEQSGAGKAFLAAARRQKRWQPDQSEREAIMRLCCALTGAPLALELAAAWLHAMSIFDIETEILQSLDFLEGSLTDLPARQASLRATFLYSWRLLSDHEKRSLRRLSIFRNGFSKEAAVAVAGITHRDILSLSEKSLLRITGQRFSLHQLIREYVNEELRQVESDWLEVGVSHAAYYLGFIEHNKHKLLTYEQVTFMPLLEQELDNFRAAMTWALTGHDQQLAMSLAEALTDFWIARGLLREGVYWLEASLDHQSMPASELLVNTWTSLAQLQQMLGDLHRSISSVQQALALASTLDDTELLASVRSVWARSLNRLGHFEEMYQVCQETMFLQLHPLSRAGALSWLAQAEMMARADLVSATKHFEEALVTFRAYNAVSGVSLVVSALGLVAAERQDFAAAKACLEEALAIAQKIGNRFAYALHSINLARIEMMSGELEQAQAAFEKSLMLSEDLAANRDISYVQIQLGHIAQRLGQPLKAEQHQRQALRLARDLNDYRLQLEALMGLANCYADRQQIKTAATYLGLALHHPQSNREIANHGKQTLAALEGQLEPQALKKIIQQGIERGLETTVMLVLSLEVQEPMGVS
jgi:predicted ATPase